MTRINFFQEQVRGFSYQKMILLSVSIILFFSMIVFFQYFRLRSASEDLIDLESQIDLIKVAQGLSTKGSEVQLNPVEQVAVAMISEPAWSDMLRVISKSLSEGIWLEAIHGDSSEGGLLTIQGTAYQARLVPGFLDRLRSYNVFSNVLLLSSEATLKEVDAPLKFKVQAKPRSK